MNKKDLNHFIEVMKKSVVEAGSLAVSYQGKVANQGKNIERLENDDAYIVQKRSAKTIIDLKVQEKLLGAALKIINPQKIYLDAEEETPLVKCFSKDIQKTTLVLDPIDGTLEYILGGDSYNIALGLIEKGILLTAIVYFPARQELFFVNKDGVYCQRSGIIQQLSAPHNINKNIIFANNRVDNKIVERLSQRGFKIINDSKEGLTWPNALIKCLAGEIGTCIFHTPQIRDVLLGFIIAKIFQGYASDWDGNIITLPNGGRIPRVLFGFESVPKEILLEIRNEKS